MRSPAAAGERPASATTLVTGEPGSGKTEWLAEHARKLIAAGRPAERLLVLAPSASGAALLDARLEEPLAFGAHAFCEVLLRSEAERAALDPFFPVATRADRVAMMLRARRASSAELPSTPRAALRAVARVDRLKEALVDCERYAASTFAEADAGREGARAFAEVYAEHERLLAEREALDTGSLLLRALDLLRDADVRARLGRHYEHLLVDDVQDAGPALRALLELLAGAIGEAVLTCDRDAVAGLSHAHPGAALVALEGSLRCSPQLLAAAHGALEEGVEGVQGAADVAFWRCADEREEAHAIAAEVERVLGHPDAPAEPSIGVFVRSLEREGRVLAAALRERAIPCRVLGASEFFERSEVRDLLAWMRLLADPLDRNAAIRLLMRPPVELRPVELARVVQIARRRKLDMPAALGAALHAPQLPPEARERIAAFLATYEELAAALEELRPEELVRRLIERAGLGRARMLEASAEALEDLASLARVGEVAAHLARLEPGASGRDFAAYLRDAADAGLSLDELVCADAPPPREGCAPVELMRLEEASQREFEQVFIAGLGGTQEEGMPRLLYRGITRARSRAVLVYPARDAAHAPQHPLHAADEARAAVGGGWVEQAPALERTDALQAAARLLRHELLDDIASIGGRLGELRLDTGEDISHGVVRYLELLKLAALRERPGEQSLADALPDLNARLLAACTPLERELLESSGLDSALLAADSQSDVTSAAVPTAAGSTSQSPIAGLAGVGEAPADARLAAFLPRHGAGLVLSASDIESYRACPLRYKFARVLRIPTEPTPQQRFGIMVHKVLERYHSEWDGRPESLQSTLPTLMRLLDAAWRRAGFRESPGELVWLERAREALTRYHRQLADQPGRPVWFERSFSFPVGGDLVRGRVDRVDRIAEERYELIDYKTGHPRTEAQLEGDVQLSLYALAAVRAWKVTAERLAYYYVLDNRKVPLPGEQDAQALRAVEQKVIDVAEGIRALDFAPRPSYAVCSSCDFLDICPAAET
jgi:superfamily I DNA/RNA helicase/RecB family exonuclease